MRNPNYAYEQLDDSVNRIRLVSIVQRKDRKRVHLKLESVLIDEALGDYEAVSYTWGPEWPRRHVMINGKAHVVRDNIWRCLKHLQDNKLQRTRLWVDSICINQSDDDEKAKQVASMGRIFASASRVLIWLGSTSLQTYLTTTSTNESVPGSISHLPPEDGDLWTNLLGHDHSTTRSLVNQIMSIVYSPYWERLWIIQEVALAQDASLIFGDTLLGPEYLEAIYFTARENSKPGYRWWIADQKDPNIVFSGTHILDHHPMLRMPCRSRVDDQEYQPRATFEDLISTYHWQHCTDPRDYVFGLIGLLDSRPHFTVDYTASNEMVAVQALHYLREEARNTAYSRLPDDAGVPCSSAAALLKALTVTPDSYMKFERGLPMEPATSLQETRLEVSFAPAPAPFGALTPGQILAMPIDYPSDLVAQLKVSGTLTKSIYEPKRHTPLQVKLLNGRYQQFHDVQAPPDHQNDTNEILMLCFISRCSIWVIICQSSTDRTRMELKHFISPDMSRQIHEDVTFLEKKVPPTLQKAFERELSCCGIGWKDLTSETQPERTFLRFSILELISMCELIAPKQADLTFR